MLESIFFTGHANKKKLTSLSFYRIHELAGTFYVHPYMTHSQCLIYASIVMMSTAVYRLICTIIYAVK